MTTPKSQPVSVRLDPETKTRLQKAAKEDCRSLSSLIEKILTEWLAANKQGKRR